MRHGVILVVVQLESRSPVDASAEAVWGALNDPTVVARCLPGATLTEHDRDSFGATLSIKVGRALLMYTVAGTITVQDHDARRLTATIKAREMDADSTVTGQITTTLSPAGDDHRPLVGLVGDVTVTGGLAALSPTVLADIVDRLLAGFTDGLSRTLGPADTGTEPLTIDAGADHGLRLLGLADTEPESLPTATRPGPDPGRPDTSEIFRPVSAHRTPSTPRSEQERASGPTTLPVAGWYGRDGDQDRWHWDGGKWTAHRVDPFSAFLSYAREDRVPVERLGQDVERLQTPIWYDDRLRGGERWWQRILDEIATCGVVVHAVSDSSLDSEYCRLELEWARTLGIAVVPVQVGTVSNPRTREISRTQLIDYRERTADQAIQLALALTGARRDRTAPPDPLPPPIAMPYANLATIRTTLQSRSLDWREQRELLSELDMELGMAKSEGVRADVASLLDILRNREDVVLRVARDAERLLHEAGHPPED